MPRYQLRVTSEQRLEDLFRSMVRKAWEVAEKQFDPRKLQPEDFTDFEAETRYSLRPFISTYDLCGMSSECSDEIEGGPWLDYEDRIYHLTFPSTFTDFVDELSLSAFHTIKHLAREGKEETVYEAIRSAFRYELAEHLYYNPACGLLDICSDSQPVNPWKN